MFVVVDAFDLIVLISCLHVTLTPGVQLLHWFQKQDDVPRSYILFDSAWMNVQFRRYYAVL
jgi:hypothetical protein